ncbi:aminopeptidase [Bacillus testis]|uniref:aminopeptidase n=1 Tax=Bacillus testis TaxID=1622072 RepID=UPI00067F12AD|nr:aminopeptidase [Bacillus testis]
MYINNYAKIIIGIGISVKKGDLVKINFHPEHLPLVREIVKEAYKNGAKFVSLDMRDPEMENNRSEFLAEEFVNEYPKCIVENEYNYAVSGFSTITIQAPHFSAKNEIETSKTSAINKAKSLAMYPVRKFGMANHNKWVVVNAPTTNWATNVFPDLPPEKAVELLWTYIYRATKSNESDPLLAWKKQDETLKKIAKKLNDYQFSALHFISEETDVTIPLVKNHIWLGGSETTQAGERFMSNIPVEEVWTMPNKYGVNGYISITKPIVLEGEMIDKVKLFFQNGKVVKIEPHHPFLQNYLLRDEGASMLGEVALVSVHSSIEKTGIVFKSTLLDENASSHIALGQAYSDNLFQGNSMADEKLNQLGMNFSSIHQDLMIGSSTMNVYGVFNQEKIQIMENGLWKI